jgi:hypothetical protein
MRFAIIPTLLAGAAQAAGIRWLNDTVAGHYKIGTNLVLAYEAYNVASPPDPNDTFKIQLTAYNNTASGYRPGPFGSQLPVYDTKEFDLAGE